MTCGIHGLLFSPGFPQRHKRREVPQREVTKAKEQNYFTGVFSEAQKINADDSLDAESDTAEPPLKKKMFLDYMLDTTLHILHL